jgi:hypothetical protein
MKRWREKMRNREEWRQIVHEAKAHLSCSAEGKEGRTRVFTLRLCIHRAGLLFTLDITDLETCRGKYSKDSS